MSTAILIVDDDPMARRAIERILRNDSRLSALEPRVVQAADGAKALTMFEQERPDLVITDLFMPVMDGFKFCRELRKSNAGERVPLVVVSGVYKDAGLTTGLATEFKAKFLPKPLQPPLLVDAVLALVHREKKATLGLSSDLLPLVGGPMDESAEDQGSLAESPLPRLLFERVERNATGTLVLVRGQVRKEIFFRSGNAVGADSNAREEALGSLLMSKGIITDAQLQHLLGEVKKRRKKMGTVLVELGWMTPEDVLRALAAQARKRIIDCLRWAEGSWSFTPGDAFGDRVTEHKLELPALIFRGLFGTATIESLATRFDEDGARPVRLLPRFSRFRPAFEAVFGRAVLMIIEGATLSSIVLRENGHALALAVEVLLLSGMAELGSELGDTQETKALSASASYGSLQALGNEVSRQLEEMNPNPKDDFADEPTPPTGSLFADAAEDDREESRPFQARPGTSSGVGPVVPAASDPAAEIRTAILREYLEVSGKPPHEVLGVPSTAPPEDVRRAYEAKSARFSDQAIAGRDLGPDAPKLVALRAAYQRALQALLDPARRPAAAQPEKEQAGHDDRLGAELAFGEGAALLAAGKPAEAFARFERAIAARPDQAAYHAHAGWAHFLAHGASALDEARDRLDHALALDPDLPRAHELRGRLALAENDHAAARRHLERALEMDATQPELVDLLARAYAQVGDPRGAERFYRRVIGALGERAQPVRQRLWRELGGIYEQLRENESARIAYESAARLAPGDLAVQRKIVELSGEDPSRWRELARALVAEWQQRPEDAGAGRALHEMFARTGHADAAVLTAGAMVVRGLADAELARAAEEGRPRMLRRLPQPLEPAARQRIAHPGEDDAIEALVAVLAEEGIIEPYSTEDLGVGAVAPLAADRQPAAFRRVLRYACEVLRVPEPEAIVPHPGLGGDARLADVRPRAILVGPALLDSTDTVELGFRLGRAMSLGTPGRVAGSARTARQLRPYLMASMLVARGPAPSDPEVDAIIRRIVGADPAVRARVLEPAWRLARRQALNLSGWVRALTRTATRTGLLLSGDLPRVARAVGDEEGPEALDDLLAFALSPEHIELREELGLTSVL